MQILAYAGIPQIYSAISIPIETPRERYTGYDGSQARLYHCLKCGSDFSIYHRRKSFQGYDDSSYFKCPSCGNIHESCARKYQVYPSDKDELVPAQIYLRVKELKEAVALEVSAKVWSLREDHDLCTAKYEEFRFDIKKRKTTFKSWESGNSKKQLQEIGDPFADIIYTSLLWHLRGDNLARESKKKIQQIMQVLRDAIRAKWKKIHGYKMKGGYVSCGQQNGYMCFPLLNLAYRLACPDAKDLPSWLNGSSADRAAESSWRCFFMTSKGEKMFADLDAFRRTQNYLTAVSDYYKLPNTPAIRKVLAEDVFGAAALAEIHRIVPDQNHLIAIYKDIKALPVTDSEGFWSQGYQMTIRFLILAIQMICAGRTGTEIQNYVRLIQKQGAYYVRDTMRMLESMPNSVITASHKVKLKHLHDWLVTESKKVQEAGYELNVPEHVVKRLQMQMDLVKFYLPNHSKELAHGGELFHNCVHTYSNSVRKGDCQIVFMTDDKGKLAACLEVRNNKLVQAKLKFNKPVLQNSAANGAIVDWCRKTGLEIATSDVRQMRYPILLEAAG